LLTLKQQYDPPPASELIERHMQTNQRLLMDLTNDDLPLPATPHGVNRLKSMADTEYERSQSAESTPVPSGTDLPASTVPTSEKIHATPPPDFRRQTRVKKRGLSIEEVEESTTAKRVATSSRPPFHFTSLRSMKVIDADGKSSPAQ
jgi:hypothetical protein